MAPKVSPPTESATRIAPIQSNLPVAWSSRLSGTCDRVAQSAMAIRGTLIRKAARHEIVSTSRPPTTGPRMVVAPDAPAQTPNARPCSSPEKLAVISASEPGTSMAPVAPCRIRKRTSVSIVGARPQSTEVTPNPASPSANIRRRP